MRLGGFVTSSVTVVQFMVQRRGSHWPSALQNGDTPPEGSRMGCVVAPNKVPDVPSDMTHRPGRTAPAASI